MIVMKKAFTLIELIIVIGILAVLIGMMISSMSGSSESALSARCLTNMKNLAVATQSAKMGAAYDKFPIPYSWNLSKPRGGNEERMGWISWYSKGKYPAPAGQPPPADEMNVSTYDNREGVYQYCLTNGLLWTAVGAHYDVYVCPKHLKVMKKHKVRPGWSYVMNAHICDEQGRGFTFGEVGSDRKLLFCELQFVNNDKIPWEIDMTPGGRRFDTALQVGPTPSRPDNPKDIIGCNHENGKNLCAHIVFGDGHIEKLEIPATKYGSGKWLINLTKNDLEELSKWLCNGEAITFNGKRFEILN